jgi:hypothetical protein
MTLILSGTDGLSDVDGSAATPAIRGTDANTGIFFPAADTIAFAEGGAEVMRIDSSGNVGIGTSSPKSDVGLSLHLFNSANTGTVASNAFLLVESSTRNSVLELSGSSTATNSLNFSDTPGTAVSGIASTIADQNLQFRTGGTTERMRIDSSGNFLVGTTSTAANPTGFSAVQYSGGTYTRVAHNASAASGDGYVQFFYNSTQIGSITQNGTTQVLYNISSDYRLKNDQQPLTGAKEFVMALQPKKWQWWDGSGEGVGFIAHEFMEVAKHSGQGEKDAVDAEGKPIMQSIQPSSSEVMANLVAFIQEQQALIQSLTDRITALETPPATPPVNEQPE